MHLNSEYFAGRSLTPDERANVSRYREVYLAALAGTSGIPDLDVAASSACARKIAEVSLLAGDDLPEWLRERA